MVPSLVGKYLYALIFYEIFLFINYFKQFRLSVSIIKNSDFLDLGFFPPKTKLILF